MNSGSVNMDIVVDRHHLVRCEYVYTDLRRDFVQCEYGQTGM